MPHTAEHRADMFRLAQERKSLGLPSWDRKIRLAEVFRNEDMGFEQRRDAIVARLLASSWLRERGDYDDLSDLIVDLGEAADVGEFDRVWDAIYDLADEDRVWIETRR